MQAKKQRLLSPTLLLFMGTMILANIAAQMIMTTGGYGIGFSWARTACPMLFASIREPGG